MAAGGKGGSLVGGPWKALLKVRVRERREWPGDMTRAIEAAQAWWRASPAAWSKTEMLVETSTGKENQANA